MVKVSNWLWDVNDPNTFSKSISTPKIIPQNSDFYNQQRQSFFAKYGPKRLEGKVIEGKLERKEREAA
jgi:hypothetical protein